jgi:hypothetical protein
LDELLKYCDGCISKEDKNRQNYLYRLFSQEKD